MHKHHMWCSARNRHLDNCTIVTMQQHHIKEGSSALQGCTSVASGHGLKTQLHDCATALCMPVCPVGGTKAWFAGICLRVRKRAAWVCKCTAWVCKYATALHKCMQVDCTGTQVHNCAARVHATVLHEYAQLRTTALHECAQVWACSVWVRFKGVLCECASAAWFEGVLCSSSRVCCAAVQGCAVQQFKGVLCSSSRVRCAAVQKCASQYMDGITEKDNAREVDIPYPVLPNDEDMRSTVEHETD
ncbi:hypothetical protein BU17DRAFT_70969 [Hysterangium stoloniferum]|nr:hypothetical protein BU17DRAFT_70969 [Hysterangium stoloniferum]